MTTQEIYNLAKEHVYLIFDIQNRFIQRLGKVQILIHKETEIEKWKNPNLVSQQAIDFFKSENPKYKDEMLNAFYTGDLIPSV